MLQDQLRGLRKVTPTKLRRVIENAAYLDARVKRFRPIILANADRSSDPLVQAAAGQLAGWNGMRIDADGNGTYDAPGAAIMDEWWIQIQHALLRAKVGAPAYGKSAETEFDDEFWGTDHASLLLHVLTHTGLHGRWPAGARLDRILTRAFQSTVTALQARYGTSDVSKWLEPRENFTYTSFTTLVSPPTNVPHMNRGTFNEIIELGR
jgi:hypothetical protein